MSCPFALLVGGDVVDRVLDAHHLLRLLFRDVDLSQKRRRGALESEGVKRVKLSRDEH